MNVRSCLVVARTVPPAALPAPAVGCTGEFCLADSVDVGSEEDELEGLPLVHGDQAAHVSGPGGGVAE